MGFFGLPKVGYFLSMEDDLIPRVYQIKMFSEFPNIKFSKIVLVEFYYADLLESEDIKFNFVLGERLREARWDASAAKTSCPRKIWIF